MLKGIKNGSRIPLTYNFCAGQTTYEQLSWCIKDVVRAVTAAGFNIAETVCNQGSSNMKAIKLLQTETDKVREEKQISQCKPSFLLYSLHYVLQTIFFFINTFTFLQTGRFSSIMSKFFLYMIHLMY